VEKVPKLPIAEFDRIPKAADTLPYIWCFDSFSLSKKYVDMKNGIFRQNLPNFF